MQQKQKKRKLTLKGEWTPNKIKHYRQQTGFSAKKMASILGLSIPTYKRLEQGIGIKKYESRLNKYYDSGYTLKQKEILLGLGLMDLFIGKREIS